MNPDPSITLYSLCVEFGCLPSEVMNERADIIQKFITIMNTKKKMHNREERKHEREMKKAKSKRY